MESKNNNKILYAVKRTNQCDDLTTILCSDGGIVEIHHNGDNYVSTYYQDRIEGEYSEESWLKLADGKQYCKDWEVKRDEIDSDMVEDALHWLNVFSKDFQEVEWDFLTNLIAKN